MEGGLGGEGGTCNTFTMKTLTKKSRAVRGDCSGQGSRGQAEAADHRPPRRWVLTAVGADVEPRPPASRYVPVPGCPD